MEDKKFDQKIAELLSQRDLDVSENAWQKVADQLPSQPSQNYFKWIRMVAAMLIIGFLFWYHQQSQQTDQTITDTKEIESEIIPNLTRDSEIKKEDLPVASIQNSNSNSKNITSIKLDRKEDHPILCIEKDAQIPELAQNVNVINDKTTNQKTIPSNPLLNESEVDVNALVMKKLKTNKTQYTIDSDELLQLVESEIQTEKDKRFRDKVIEKVKTTVHDWNVAFK